MDLAILLVVLGCILAFAVTASIGFISLVAVGKILIAAGLLLFVLALFGFGSRRYFRG